MSKTLRGNLEIVFGQQIEGKKKKERETKQIC